ncbi:hypothetical protein I3843_13G150100 [Carya illinoinensis]|uniref:Dirigent protein n=1 Tax=Carya illinoinensis TaxID=32201 RepID=A0A8T1NQE5_CARIL|nr:dirigent protein 22-like [Carya illinoinensis]KAG6632625.1 hypothetical protein CIPAW_13G172100 [Carya illinoinensis]KAG6683013.1 hypothetical protein I3842_13G171300 [Carya illinoinensis]KAG7951106.1 hypothetical protein I3843_13G150100 [Carya illinoinensis]
MAGILPTMASQLLVFFLVSSFCIILVSGEEESGFGRALDRKLLGLKKEKLSHFRFYFHDIVGGPNPTAVQVVPPPSNASATFFGLVRMFDNPLTLGPKLSSKSVGKAQGFYASAAQEEIAFLMVMNFAFTEGKYNGSTLSILGRNNGGSSRVREMPVIGGSRLFRFARGYAQATTHSFEPKTGDATIEYNVYVFHY